MSIWIYVGPILLASTLVLGYLLIHASLAMVKLYGAMAQLEQALEDIAREVPMQRPGSHEPYLTAHEAMTMARLTLARNTDELRRFRRMLGRGGVDE